MRARVDGELVGIVGCRQGEAGRENRRHNIEVVVDRLVVDPAVRVRLSDSMETALKWGDGRVMVLHQGPSAAAEATWLEQMHSNRMYSPATGLSYDTPTPKHFFVQFALRSLSSLPWFGAEACVR